MAKLSLVPNTGQFADSETASVDIVVDTAGASVVVVAAYLNFDPALLDVSTDLTGSLFPMAAENVVADGKVKLSLGVPTPGVNVPDGKVATLKLKAKSPFVTVSNNVVFDFAAGDTTRSNVFLGDGLGTPVLTEVVNGMYSFKSFRKSDFDRNSIVDAGDFEALKGMWQNTSKPLQDINQDGTVNAQDLSIMMAEWGAY